MSWTRTISSVCLASALALSPVTADAQGRGRGQEGKPPKAEKPQKADKPDKAQKPDKDKHVGTSGHVVIDRDGHVRVIRDYWRSGSLPPGLAKREALPPGLRKQLHERGELPPGLQKRLIPVPAPWIARLPAVPAHHTRYFAGDDFIVIDTRTNRVVAIVRDVWR